MIKTTAILLNELKDYKSPADKLGRLVKEGTYTSIVKGLYETDASTSGYLLAEAIYGPSYLSFEYALAHHGLIPEAVYNFTSATFDKKKKKYFETPFGIFTYRDIPMKAYPYGVDIVVENNRGYKIATVEKALCDQLYKMNPVANYKELEELLFSDLRIEPLYLKELNREDICFLAERYGCGNVKKFSGFIRRL